MNIYLADLRANRNSSSEMPLNIGNIAAFLKKHMGDSAVIRLFTEPQGLMDAIDRRPPEVLMLSNYCWNKNLSLFMARYAKEKCDKTVSVMGGPNIALNNAIKKKFMENNSFIDFYILFDGELPSLRLMEELKLHDFDINKTKAKAKNIESIIFLAKGRYIEFPAMTRLDTLDEIPSPYAMGIMDMFFSGHFIPKIQSVRGCPHSCAYCNMGIPYYNKLLKMSLSRFKSELDVIVDKMVKYNYKIRPIHLIDDNFGLLPEDIKKAEIMKEKHDVTGYPDYIMACTTKNINEKVMEIARSLKDYIYISHTPQSLNVPTLAAIKRPFKGVEHFIETGKRLTGEGFLTVSENISSLPLETRESFIKGLSILDGLNITDYIIYQLTVIDGSPMDDENYLNKYGMKVRYRPYPDSRIKIGDTVIEEYEKVVYETSTMSEEDYHCIRLIGFLLRLQLGLGAPLFFNYLRQRYNISGPCLADLIVRKILDYNFGAQGNMAISFLRDFNREAHEELLDSPRAINPSAPQRKNLVHKYKSLLLTKSYASLCDLYFETLSGLAQFKEERERMILSAFCEHMKLTDIRALFVNDKVPTIDELKKYKAETYDIDNISGAVKTDFHLPRALYVFPDDREEVIRTILMLCSNSDDDRVLASNDYGYSNFKLKKESLSRQFTDVYK